MLPGSQHLFLVWGQPNILWGQLYFEKWLSSGQPLFEAIFTALGWFHFGTFLADLSV